MNYAATIQAGASAAWPTKLIRDGIDPPPGLASIYRVLVRNGLIQPRPRRRPKADYRRWEWARPMELWQLDVMGGIWLTDGRKLKAVTGIDDHSRFRVAAGLIERANARSVCRVFTLAGALRHPGRAVDRQRQDNPQTPTAVAAPGRADGAALAAPFTEQLTQHIRVDWFRGSSRWRWLHRQTAHRADGPTQQRAS